jgi:hypothetical protein
MDTQQFFKNRAKFPPEELEKYVGQYIAWSADGTRILASDEEPLRLMETLDRLGVDPGETVISYVPEEDGSLILAAVEA